MSDLQCAATLLLARHGEAAADADLTPRGQEQAHALGRSLRARRLAVVYTSRQKPAVQTAAIVEGETGAPVVVREGLDDRSVAELEALADLHRGETVLVLTGVGDEQDGCSVVEVSIDADGWAARR
jgi:broad specificity phosphatase PhoE